MAKMTMQERIAAAKAQVAGTAPVVEAAAQVAPAPAPAKTVALVLPAAVAPRPAAPVVHSIPANVMVQSPEHKLAPGTPIPAISWKERVEQKKREAAAGLAKPTLTAPEQKIVQAAKPLPPATVLPAYLVPETIKEIAEAIPLSTEVQLGTATAEQAYADIKPRIDRLTELSGDDLTNSMLELKTALLKNPAAVSLMLDEDIGKMVIGLRQITGEASSEAAKGKTKGPKAKVKAISLADIDLASAFDEM